MRTLPYTTCKLVISGFALVLLSCSSHPSNDRLFKVLEESLNNSNQAIGRNTYFNYMVLQDKLTDPPTEYKAKIWEPKAGMVQEYAGEINNYLEQLKKQFIEKAGVNKEGKANMDDEEAAEVFFVKGGKGAELYVRLMDYKAKLLAIDSLIDNQFGNDPSFFRKSNPCYQDTQNFTKFFFERSTPAATLAVLSQFENSIRIMEDKVVQYCNVQVTNNSMIVPQYPVPIVSQSSSVVQAGESIEVTAGVGLFNGPGSTQIFINGKNIPLQDEGYSVAKVRTSAQAGVHFIPVKIQYSKLNGAIYMFDKTIRYVVVKEP